MVGFVEGAAQRVPLLLEIAINWFVRYGADTWLDTDEFGVVFNQTEVIARAGFQLVDDWNAMLCRRLAAVSPNPAVKVTLADSEADLLGAAWIAEQIDRREAIDFKDLSVRRRKERYWREYNDWGTRFALARLGGRPVGTARLTEEELPVVVGVATLLEARNRGVATAVTATLTRMALDRHGLCALYAGRESQAARIYRRLGYQSLFSTRAWLRPYSPDARQ